MPKILIVALFLSLVVGACSSACTGMASVPVAAGGALVKCAGENADEIAEMVSRLGEDPIDWDKVTAAAVDAGLSIGGCAFAILVDRYIRGRSLTTSLTMVTDAWSARRAFEHYRSSHANGAVFQTPFGDL